MGVLSRTPAPIDADRPAAADLLRVLAAWAVGVFHIWQQSWYSGAAPAHWLRAGRVGVVWVVLVAALCLFLPWAIAGALGRPVPLTGRGAFYRRRAVRLLPAYYASLLFSLVLALHNAGWSRTLGIDLAAHLTLTQQLFPQSYLATRLNGVTWTLTVFALFYLVFPLLAPLCVRRPLPTLGALCAVQLGYTLWALPQYGSAAYSSLFNQLPAFCGVLAVGLAAALVFARLARGGWTQRLLPRAGCTLLGALALVWLNAQLRTQAYAAEFQRYQLVNRMPLALAAAAVLVCGFAAGASAGGLARWYMSAAVLLGAVSWRWAVQPAVHRAAAALAELACRPLWLVHKMLVRPAQMRLQAAQSRRRACHKAKKSAKIKKSAEKRLQKPSKVLYN